LDVYSLAKALYMTPWDENGLVSQIKYVEYLSAVYQFRLVGTLFVEYPRWNIY